jgi:uncharacterized protein YjdB
MKQTLHTSRRAFKLALLCLMAFVTWGGNYCIAQETASLVFTKAPENGKATDTKNMTWSVSSDGAFFGCEKVKGLHYGSAKKAVKAIDVSTSAYADVVIKKIVVNASAASSVKAKVKCEVGGAAFGVEKKLTSSNAPYTFEGSASGNILVSVYKASKETGALYIKSIEITYSTANLETTTLTLTAPDSPISIGGTYTSTPTLKAGEQTLSDKTITWSSDNDKVATVDAATGTVTGVAAGKANITAKFAGDEVYKTSTASYEIIVKGAPALSFPQTSYTVEMGDVFSTPKLEGLPEGVTPAYTSSNTNVATIDAATGEVKIVGVGTTTITVTSPETGIYEGATASYELNVKAAIYKVEFDFTTNNWGLPTGYNKGEASYTNEAGYTITFGISSSGHKIMGSDSDCNLIFGKEDATLSLPAFPFAVSKIKVFGKKGASGKVTQNIFVGNEAVSTETTNATEDHIYEIAEAFQAVGNIYTLKVTNANNTQITKIVVYAKDETIAGAINIATEEGFGTFYTDKNYVLPQGLTAFGYTSIDGNTLTKSVEYVAGDIVPANTAVVVKGAKGSYNYYNTEETATKNIEKNLLKGVTTDTRFEATSGVKRYILTRADDGILAFYRTNTGNINVKANRAYLEVPTAMAVASFSLEGSATGINNVVTIAAKQGIYTISGVRLNATTTKGLPAGIYIVDGKKVIVK